MKTTQYKSLIFITGNAAKAAQLAMHLDFPVEHKKIDLVEIQSLDLDEIIGYKAKEAYSRIKKPVLVEDTSLKFSALNNLPGPLVKWFMNGIGNKGLCKLLDGYNDRTAEAEVCFGLYDGNSLKTFRNTVKGSIAIEPAGKTGFGWDPIFIPAGRSKTWGEMDMEEQMQTSVRRGALKKLEAFLLASSDVRDLNL